MRACDVFPEVGKGALLELWIVFSLDSLVEVFRI
jgi:hypothetical protein